MPHRLLDLETRRRFIALIQKYPGLHVREAARQLGEDQALLAYHLPKLVEAGLVIEEKGARYSRLFPTRAGRPVPASPQERKMLAVLREPIALKTVLFLLDNGPARHGQLATGLGMLKGHLSYHVGKLQKAGVVRRTATGEIELENRTRMLRLLLENEPTKDLLDRFLSLWNTLYGDSGFA